MDTALNSAFHNGAESRPRQESRERNIGKRIEAICKALGMAGVLIEGDPRGATIKVLLPSERSNSWGGEGWCVPTF